MSMPIGKSMTPKVTVVIPCYHQTQYLDECIRSVLSQTYQDFEIIVVDDGTTVESELDYFNRLCYPKTKVIHQNNKGLAGARNFGIEQAKGEYILPLDADDKIVEVFLERTVPVLMQNENVGIVGGRTEFFGAKTGLKDQKPYSFPAILFENRLVCTQLFRRADWEKVGGYNTNMIYGLEDWDFWLSLVELERRVVQFDEVLFLYRQHKVSMVTKLQSDFERYQAATKQLVANHLRLYETYSSYRDFHLFGKRSLKSFFPRVICKGMRDLRLQKKFPRMYNCLSSIP